MVEVKKGFVKVLKFLHRHIVSKRLETGFSMLEAVVVVGVLLALAIGGFVAYGTIAENAKKAQTRSAASQVHTGVITSTFDGDTSTDPQKVLDEWNGSTDKIRVEIVSPKAGETSANGDYCIEAIYLSTPTITARSGACPVGNEPGNGSGNSPSANDIDGDGISNDADPDIDGDGTPNTEDPTPNGETTPPGGGVVTPPAACSNLSSTEEISCWMEIANVEETRVQAETGFYFGDPYPGDTVSRPYTGTAFQGLTLLNGFHQEAYDDPDPAWSFVGATVTMAARDGEVWEKQFYNEYNQVDGNYSSEYIAGPTGQNVNYDCKYVTPQQLLPVCGRLGMNLNMYSDKKPDNDNVADSDVRKILEAQLTYIKANKAPYGGYNAPVDATAFAGTSYNTKVYSISDGWQAHKVRAIVIGANGDLYTAEARITNSSTSIDYTFAATFRYSPNHVASVCERPYIDRTFQAEDVKTCQTLGYTNFKP
jgi:hypothetical protein